MSSIKEKGRAVWGKVTSSLESGVDQAQAELGKLQEQAARTPDEGKARIRAKIGETRARQDADQEKLRSNLASAIADADIQIGELDAAATGVSGAAREKIMHDAEQARAERTKAHDKLVTNLEAEKAEVESEMERLQREATDAPPDAAARILARAEWARLRRDAVQGSLQSVK